MCRSYECVSRVCVFCVSCFVFLFKQRTAYEMRISDWSSDVCSSDLLVGRLARPGQRVLDLYCHTGAFTLLAARAGATVLGVDRSKPALDLAAAAADRSEERRVGKECVRTWRTRWSPYN